MKDFTKGKRVDELIYLFLALHTGKNLTIYTHAGVFKLHDDQPEELVIGFNGPQDLVTGVKGN